MNYLKIIIFLFNINLIYKNGIMEEVENTQTKENINEKLN